MLGECQRRPVDHSPLTEFLILVKTIAGSFNKRTVTGIPKSVHGEGLDSALRSCFLSSQSPRRGWVPRKERRWLTKSPPSISPKRRLQRHSLKRISRSLRSIFLKSASKSLPKLLKRFAHFAHFAEADSARDSTIAQSPIPAIHSRSQSPTSTQIFTSKQKKPALFAVEQAA